MPATNSLKLSSCPCRISDVGPYSDVVYCDLTDDHPGPHTGGDPRAHGRDASLILWRWDEMSAADQTRAWEVWESYTYHAGGMSQHDAHVQAMRSDKICECVECGVRVLSEDGDAVLDWVPDGEGDLTCEDCYAPRRARAQADGWALYRATM